VHSASGFTLVELLVTIAVGAVLTVVAVPAMTRFLDIRAVEARAGDLAEAMREARSAAVERVSDVYLCSSTTTASPNPTCGSATSWSQGWLSGVTGVGELQVYVPENGRAKVSASTASVTFVSTGSVRTGCARFVFEPAGVATPPSSDVRTVCLQAQGRVVVQKGASAPCC